MSPGPRSSPRTSTAVLALCVALLAVTAGCGVFTGPTTPEATTDAGGSPTTATAAGEPAFPTGFGPEGAVDGSAALNGHTNVLLASGNFTFVFVSESETPEGTTNTTLVNRVDADRRVVLRTVDRADAVATQYVTGGTAFTRIDPRDDRAVQYRSSAERMRPTAATARPLIAGLMNGVDWADPQRVTVDGEPAVRYTAAELTNASAVLEVGDGAVASFDATLVVAANGIVKRASYTATYSRDGRQVTDRVRVRFEAVGSTAVEQPGWVDRQFQVES
jgi:hypothetical protein